MLRLKSQVLAAVARWNAGDIDGYLAIYDPRLRFYGYGAGILGLSEVQAMYRAIWTALSAPPGPNPYLIVDQLVEDGDSLAMRFVITGRHQKCFMGVPATGRSYILPGITIMHFSEGRCVERWSNADLLNFFVQLGALSMPEA